MLKKIKKNEKGFTLVELVVVIAILGILAAIAVPRMGAFREQAALGADNATAAMIGKAAETVAAAQNMDDTARAAVTITTLTNAGLLNATDLVPQHPDATAQTIADWTLTYDTTDMQFEVTLAGVADVRYPKN